MRPTQRGVAGLCRGMPTNRSLWVNVVALSGGKDSVAMSLELREREPYVETVYLITPTDDELPEMKAHWADLEKRLGQPMTVVTHHTLQSLIEGYEALPNFRQRWCTRQIKVEPCVAWMKRRQQRDRRGHFLCVGLRADEPERQGLYSNLIHTRFPLREWGWGIRDVWACLKKHGVKIPRRTDCARCYGQRLGEWWELWKKYPGIYADAEAQEARYGHTFRSPQRDTWPASLKGLRERFEAGDIPRGTRTHLPMYVEEDEEDDSGACRICRL